MKFNTADEAFSLLESFTNLEKAPNLTAREYRLDRMAALLPLFDNPHLSFRSIHVAGSKGKGSTAAFIASALTANGLKTGLYCSPHVNSYKERISLSGEFFPDSLYAETASEMMDVVDAEHDSPAFSAGPPTTFELLTLLAFLIFRKAGCEWAVLETGLGGRLDATNVVTPEASVLTPIELEHTEYLGDTISLIAGEKAGIIKPGVPVFSAYQPHPEAAEVFKIRAGEKSAPIFFPEDIYSNIEIIKPEAGSLQKAELTYKDGSLLSFNLKSAGSYQVLNAALGISCLRHLSKEAGILPPDFDPADGISDTVLPGRMELLTTARGENKTIPVILDGAHTRKSAELAAQAFFEAIAGKPKSTEPVLIFGAVSGKDVKGMAEILSKVFSRIIISTPGVFKISDPSAVYDAFCEYTEKAILVPNPSDALEFALQSEAPVFVTGSFYMVSEIRKLLL